jgi:X-X-X-Leu-X-X-Gly heptad repeat protein
MGAHAGSTRAELTDGNSKAHEGAEKLAHGSSALSDTRWRNCRSVADRFQFDSEHSHG